MQKLTHLVALHYKLSQFPCLLNLLPTICIGEGNGNPLQCSCLENPRDRGAWWAAIYGVTQSQTRLKRLSSSSTNMEYLPLSLVFPCFPCAEISFIFCHYIFIFWNGQLMENSKNNLHLIYYNYFSKEEMKSFITSCMPDKSLQLCLTLCDPIGHSTPGSSVHGILQARIQEWSAMPLSRLSHLFICKNIHTILPAFDLFM